MRFLAKRLLAMTLSLVLFSGPAAHGQTIKDFCTIRTENLLSGRNHNALAGAVFDEVPNGAEKETTRTHRPSVSVFYQLPRDKIEYAAVYTSIWDTGPKIKPEDVSAVAVDEMRKATELAERSGENMSGDARTISDLYDFISKSPDEFVVVIGHSEDGNFKTRDGQTTQIVEIANRCRALDKVCVVISCNSKDYLTDGSHGITRSITFSEGVFIANKVHNWISSRDYPLNPEVVSLYIKSVQVSAFARFHASYIVVRGCGAAASLMAVDLLVEGVEELSCPCSLPSPG